MNDHVSTDRTWYATFLSHLLVVYPTAPDQRAQHKGPGDTRAFAELRNAARGGPFELRALPHIVPYIAQLTNEESYSGRDQRRLQIAILVGSLYASFPPELNASEPADPGQKSAQTRDRSIGWYLGLADTQDSDETIKSRKNPSALERHLALLVATEFQDLGLRMRSTFARVGQSGQRSPLRHTDFGRLFRDLDGWGISSSPVQKQWVNDFYRARYWKENQSNKE